MSKSYWLDEQEVHINQNDPEIIEAIPQTSIEIRKHKQIGDHGEDRLVFDLINAPPSYANAFRRTLLSRVPSIAIELVGMKDNTGVMPDEMVCHRLGMIPIRADWDQFEYPDQMSDVTGTYNDPDRCILFGMHVIGWEPTTKHPDHPGNPTYAGACSDWEPEMPPRYTEADGYVYSGDLIWLPFPGQHGKLWNVEPLQPDIPITKLRPGQRLHLYARCVKGIGADHAKFSPACTVFYRYISKFAISQSMPPALQQSLVESCPKKVFEIEDGFVTAKRPRKCTTCRECIRKPELAKYVSLGKEGNQYEFTVESVGVKPATELVKEAFKVLAHRCNQLRDMINS